MLALAYQVIFSERNKERIEKHIIIECLSCLFFIFNILIVHNTREGESIGNYKVSLGALIGKIHFTFLFLRCKRIKPTKIDNSFGPLYLPMHFPEFSYQVNDIFMLKDVGLHKVLIRMSKHNRLYVLYGVLPLG